MKTSWGGVADWYDDLLGQEDTYQSKVILPNLTRLVAPRAGDKILDLACGQGFFSRSFAEAGAKVIGVDISMELIEKAKEKPVKSLQLEYFVSPSHKLSMIQDASIDKVTIVLALQNIEKMSETFDECVRVLKTGGSLFLVLNHPTFRIPKRSSWHYDEEQGIQYRRIDGYLSESKAEIDMHPGQIHQDSEQTVSFHRPLQVFFKALNKSGFIVSRLEEWNSHKKSQQGKRSEAEDRARKEIPLFMCLEARKI
jgi:ubiquinone/menaquinone biosynthesis C-methylase UbiE